MNNFNFKSIIPHLIALVAFVAVTFGYLNPLLKSKELKQSDISQFQGMSKEIKDFREKNGSEPLWTNSMFGGMPAYQISVLYPSNLLSHVDKVLSLYLPRPADYLFLCMLGFYFLLCVLKVDSMTAAVGAIAYALCSYYIISLEVGHTSKAHAIAYMAPILASFILTFRGKFFLGAALTALFLGLQLYSNHLQITYYTIMLLGVYVLFEMYGAIKEKRVALFAKAVGFLFIGAVIGFLPNTTNIWLTYDYGKYTTRGKSELTIPSPDQAADSTNAQNNNQTGGLPRDYITQWSVGVGETFTLLIPNYKGGETEAIGTDHKDALKGVKPAFKKQIAQSNAYYGDQPFTAGPTYAGAIIVFLFVMGLMFVSGPFKWAMLVATILSITFSWGGNWPGLFNFAVDYIPGYNKFRSVSMMLTVANFTLPLLGLFGLYKVLTTPDFFSSKMTLFGKETNFKNLHGFILVFALTGGLCLLMYLTPTTFNTFLSSAEIDQFTTMGDQAAASGNQQYTDQIVDYQDSLEAARISIFKADALRSFLFIFAAAGLLFAYFKFTFDKRIVIGIVGLLIVVDLVMVDQRFLNAKSFTSKKEIQVPFPKNNAINSILADNTPGKRTLNMAASFTQDASVSYYTSSIGGYHGAKLKRYQQLIDFRIDGEIEIIRKTFSAGGLNDSLLNAMYKATPTLNMLNTKYIIVNPNYPALSNPYALGAAWFVKDIQLVENPDAEILALNKIDPAQTAVVDKAFTREVAGAKPSFDSSATIKLVSYQPNNLVYESNSSVEQFAVFSEIYYKNGWNAYVDGKATDYVRANFVLRAMKVPAGKHKIEFKFEPEEYKKGETMALAGSIILFLALAGALFLELRRKKEEEPVA
jgi:hypothetical protein